MTAIKLPATKPYRVRIAGAVYNRHKEEVTFDGKPVEVVVRELALRGQEIELTEREAHRLTELDAVLPADSVLEYDEMDEKKLAHLVEQRGITVKSTGADPDQPLRTDLINALVTYDQGHVGEPAPPAEPVYEDADEVEPPAK